MGSKARTIPDRETTSAKTGPMSALPPVEEHPGESSNKDVAKELIGEAVGIEKGFLRTLIDLKKKPADVLESYLRNEHTYLNPFRLLFSIATVWAIVMNFIFDWNAIGQEYANGLNDMFDFIDPSAPKERTEYVEFVGFMFDALFAKYFLALVIILIPIQGLLCTRFTRSLGIPLKKHLSVLAYQGSLKMLVGFFLVLGFAIHVLGTFIFMFAILVAGLLGWKFAYTLASGIPVERFFRKHGKEIDKAYRKTGLVVIVSSVFIGMIVGVALVVVDRMG